MKTLFNLFSLCLFLISYQIAYAESKVLIGTGQAGQGQLGENHIPFSGIPSVIQETVKFFDAGDNHTVFIKMDQTLWGLGANWYGALGVDPVNGNTTGGTTDEPVLIDTDVVMASAGAKNTFYIKTDGSLWGLGLIDRGEGDETASYQFDPIFIDNSVVDVSSDGGHILYIKEDLTLWGFGGNSVGQLGDGTSLERINPVFIENDVTAISTSGNFSLFLKSDSSLWAMGNNDWGEHGFGLFGAGDLPFTLSPIKIMDNVIEVEASNDFSLIIKSDNSLWASGRNNFGQFGNGTTDFTNQFVQIHDRVIDVASGQGHTLFIRDDNTLWAMGYNAYGQLGNQGQENSFFPVKIAYNVFEVSAGNDFSLFLADNTPSILSITTSHTVSMDESTTLSVETIGQSPIKYSGNSPVEYQWYIGESGDISQPIVGATSDTYNSEPLHSTVSFWVRVSNDLGSVDSQSILVEVEPAPMTNPVYLSFQEDPGLVIQSNLEGGALRTGATDGLPNGYLALTDAVESSHSLVLLPDFLGGEIVHQFDFALDVRIGNGLSDLPADGISISLVSPEDPLLSSLEQSSFASNQPESGSTTGLAISLDSWGGNLLPDGEDIEGLIVRYDNQTLVRHPLPTRNSSPEDATSIQTGPQGSGEGNQRGDPSLLSWRPLRVVLDDQNELSIWWKEHIVLNSFPIDHVPDSYRVVLAARTGLANQIHHVDNFYMAVNEAVVDQSLLFGMGWNGNGQVGNGSDSDVLRPEIINSNITSFAAGWWHSFLIDDENNLWGWGWNNEGQVGDGTTDDYNLPVLVSSDVAQVDGGWWHSMFVKTDGTLWGVGWNGRGQFGDGTFDSRTTPVQVADGVKKVALGSLHSVFLKVDGTLWAMGHSENGQLGTGTTDIQSTPIQIDTDVIDIDVADEQTFYVKDDGTLWAMGFNEEGQLGDGTTDNRLSPIQIASDVRQVAAGDQHTLFVKNDDTLWGMGGNQFGQLGDSSSEPALEPKQIASGVIYAAAGESHSLYVDIRRSLWAMGRNNAGQLGDGTRENRFNAIQIASNVDGVDAGAGHTFFTAELPPKIEGLPPYSILTDQGTFVFPFSVQTYPSEQEIKHIGWENLNTDLLLDQDIELVEGENGHELHVTPRPGTHGFGEIRLFASDMLGRSTNSILKLRVVPETSPLEFGSVDHHVFNGIRGRFFDDTRFKYSPQFPLNPDRIETLNNLEFSWNEDDYIDKTSGYITAPETGEYIFYLASDDEARFYFSSDESILNLKMIAREPVWNGFRDYLTLHQRNPENPENRSQPIYLEEGRSYYFELYHGEYIYDDHAGVTWKKPSDSSIENGQKPISGLYLSRPADGVKGQAPKVLKELVPPITTDIKRGGSINLGGAIFTGSEPLSLQWEHNENPIEGGNDPVLFLSGPEEVQAGSYRLRISNDFGTAYTQPIEIGIREGKVIDVLANPGTGNVYYVTEPMSATAAQVLAAEFGGNLVVIEDQQEQDWITENLASVYNFLWIGLQDIDPSNAIPEFEWVTGTPLDFTNWSSGEPNQFLQLNEHRANMWFDGTWNDSNQENQYHGIIELIPPSDPYIYRQPGNQVIVGGQFISLEIKAVASRTPAYQWYIGESGDTSQPIEGATDGSYTSDPLNSTTSYWARISNENGSTDSDTITVEVIHSVAFDFNGDPGLQIQSTMDGDVLRTSSNEGNPGGYLALTDALEDQFTAVLFPDFLQGSTVDRFELNVDLRVGNGTSDLPADGFSINLVEPGDPLLSSLDRGNFVGFVPENGATSGLSFSFDAFENPIPRADVTSPEDPVIASSDNINEFEDVGNAIDDLTSKYLNHDSGGAATETGFVPSGFVVTPSSGLSIVNGLSMLSANDAPERDPVHVTLEGSNDETIDSFHSGNWELIADIADITPWTELFPDDHRFRWQTFDFQNDKAFKHYRWTVMETAVTPNGCCMQISEVELLGHTQETRADVVGLEIRLDGEVIAEKALPALHGEPNDADSLQTGGIGDGTESLRGDPSVLSWQPFRAVLNGMNELTVEWKGTTLIEDLPIDYNPTHFRVVVAGRTGLFNQIQHLDNLILTLNQTEGGSGDNEPPHISELEDMVVVLGQQNSPITFNLSDDDTPIGDLTIMVGSSNQSVVSDAQLILENGSVPGQYNLSITPATTGETIITIKAIDADDAVAIREFNFRVIADNTVAFQLGNVSATPGSEVAVPVSVSRFADLTGFQMTISWDPSQVNFNRVEDFNLPDLAGGNFSLSNTEAGFITVSWNDSSLQGVSLEDGEAAFSIVFTPITAAGSDIPVFIIDSPTPLEVTDVELATVPSVGIAGRIRVQDSITLSGTVAFWNNGVPITGVDIEVITNIGTEQIVSDEDGAFSLNMESGSGIEIRARRQADQPANQGVSTLDILLTRRHILDPENENTRLGTPFQLLAADVNRSGSVSTLDILLIRRLILDPINFGFYQVDEDIWTMVPATHTFADPLTPWNHPTGITLTTLSTHKSDLDFKAVKLGDINGNWTPSQSLTTLSERSDPVSSRVWVQSQARELSEPILFVPVWIERTPNLTSLQFTLEWDADTLQFNGISEFGLPDMSREHIGMNHTDQGMLSLAWDSVNLEGADAMSPKKILVLTFIKKNDRPATSITIKDSLASRELTSGLQQRTAVYLPGLILSHQDMEMSRFHDFPGGLIRFDHGRSMTLWTGGEQGRNYTLESVPNLNSPSPWRIERTQLAEEPILEWQLQAGLEDEFYWRIRSSAEVGIFDQ